MGPVTSRRNPLAPFALALTCGLLVSACGGSDGASTPGNDTVVEIEADTSTTADDAAPETAPDTSDAAAATDATAASTTTPIAISTTDTAADPTPATTLEPAAEPGSGTVGSSGDASWDGGDFVDLADTRMDEIATVFGLPATATSLAPIFALPDDFPYPAGTVAGTFHVFDLDLRITDAIDIAEERIVGVDGANDISSFDEFATSLEADETTRWARASSQRDGFVNDLFTADPLDRGESKDRMFLQAATEPEPGQPPVMFTFDAAPTEIPVPGWQAGLPILDGGEVTYMREGRGLVEDFGRFAEDGHVELRVFYPIDRFDDLAAFFESGVIAAAGFQSEDTPFSNLNIRVDVSNGDWAGTVGVGDVNVNNEDVGYELIWSLTRPA